MSNTIVLNIKGCDWTFRLMSDKAFEKKHLMEEPDDACEAITNGKLKYVDFKKSWLSIQTIRHELMHVIVFLSCVESSNLSCLQMEELCCELIGTHLVEMELWAEKILTSFLNRE